MMLKTIALIVSVLRNQNIDNPATATKKWLKNNSLEAEFSEHSAGQTEWNRGNSQKYCLKTVINDWENSLKLQTGNKKNILQEHNNL